MHLCNEEGDKRAAKSFIDIIAVELKLFVLFFGFSLLLLNRYPVNIARSYSVSQENLRLLQLQFNGLGKLMDYLFQC